MKGGRRTLWAGAALVIAGCAAAALALHLRGPQIEVVQVQRTPLVRTLQFSARVATRSRVDIGATVTGRVAQVLVAEGVMVRAGDALVQLEDQEWRAALAQAEAAEQQAEALLSGLRGSGRTAAEAGLAQAQAGARAANAALVRAEQLLAQGFYSPAQLDEARRAAAVAQAQARSAQAQLAANADTGSEVRQARAQGELARAGAQASRARLAQATLRAPADGRVLLRQVEPGQIVQPGKALLSLALAGPTELVAQVDERFLEQLRAGQSASVVADAFPEQRFTAQVLSLAPAVDAERGAVEVKFALTGSVPAFLREDMTLSVEVETARRDAALVLPQRAVRTPAHGGPPEVLVVEDGRAQVRVLRLGLSTLGAVEVLEGLAQGELVLAAPSVAPGARVRAKRVDWVPAAPPSAARAEDAGAAMANAMGR